MQRQWSEAYEGELRAVLPVRGLGSPMQFMAQTPSTNDDALRLAAEGAPHGTLVVADHQTAGRGRRGRDWLAPPGSSLLFSLVLRPSLAPDRLGLLTTALGVAGVRAARALRVEAQLKWPNDVTVSGKKLAGILVESRLADSGLDSAVAGMGFNVAMERSAWPKELRDRATSLAIELDEPPTRAKVLAAVLAELGPLLDLIESDDAHELVAAAEDLSAVLGSDVDVRMADGSAVTGRARRLTATGALVIATETGDVEVSAGEIETLRPA